MNRRTFMKSSNSSPGTMMRHFIGVSRVSASFRSLEGAGGGEEEKGTTRDHTSEKFILDRPGAAQLQLIRGRIR